MNKNILVTKDILIKTLDSSTIDDIRRKSIYERDEKIVNIHRMDFNILTHQEPPFELLESMGYIISELFDILISTDSKNKLYDQGMDINAIGLYHKLFIALMHSDNYVIDSENIYENLLLEGYYDMEEADIKWLEREWHLQTLMDINPYWETELSSYERSNYYVNIGDGYYRYRNIE